jgi:hypothetical protein
VLKLDRRIFVAEQWRCFLNNREQFSRLQTVLNVICHPGLELALDIVTDRSTAVDEGLGDKADLGDMGVQWRQVSIR